jgi:aminoglycoside 2''-phosphotransferase
MAGLSRIELTEDDARVQIARACPGLDVGVVEFLGAGVDSDVFLVNGEWVFRFPKRAPVARALRREINLLPKLAAHLPVATPRFDYVGHHSTSGLLFAGYRLIPGQPLSAKAFGALGHREQARVLARLARFLCAVHGFPVAEAVAAGVEQFEARNWVSECWAQAQHALARLEPWEGAALARLLEGFLADGRNFAERPMLLYADFAPEHVLYDAAAGGIVGIIDWGDVAIGDPDFDLLYLRQDYGEDFVVRMLEHYPHPEPARLVLKLRVFDACDHITTIAAGGTNASAHDAVDESVTALRENVRTLP